MKTGRGGQHPGSSISFRPIMDRCAVLICREDRMKGFLNRYQLAMGAMLLAVTGFGVSSAHAEVKPPEKFATAGKVVFCTELAFAPHEVVVVGDLGHLDAVLGIERGDAATLRVAGVSRVESANAADSRATRTAASTPYFACWQ